MTDTQFAACVREVPAYADVDAYVSDLALSSMWGDTDTADIPAARIDQLRAIYTAVNRTPKEIVAASGLSQAAFAERYCIPKRTVEDWCRGVMKCPLYTRLLLQRAEGLLQA